MNGLQVSAKNEDRAEAHEEHEVQDDEGQVAGEKVRQRIRRSGHSLEKKLKKNRKKKIKIKKIK